MQGAISQRSSSQAHPSDPILAGHTVLVAGGTGNVGRYVVRSLLDRGATVVVPSRSSERLAALRSSIGDSGADRLLTLPGDVGDEQKAAQLQADLKARCGTLHAVVASLGRFVVAPSVLNAPLSDLRSAVSDYVFAHLLAARSFIPLLRTGGSYTFINGPLAFGSLFDGGGLVSIATAAQAMLTRLVMKETSHLPLRVNEAVIYTPFGWGEEAAKKAPLSPEEVARYLAHLMSPRGAAINGQTIHLNAREPLQLVGAA